MAAYRCSVCNNCYPVLTEYRRCPPCDIACWLSDSSEPMEISEARSIVNHEAFDRYCEQRDLDNARAANLLLDGAFDAHT